MKVIGRAGVGLDNVDVDAASERGIVVCFTPEQNSLSVAELTVGLMLTLARRIAQAHMSTRAGRWERQVFTGSELYGKTLGLIGLGRIGLLTAVRAAAFGMRILVADPQMRPDSLPIIHSHATLVSLDELLRESDYVSIHVPQTPQTTNLLNDARLAQMKPTAFLINTSRGGVIDVVRAAARALPQRKSVWPVRAAGCPSKGTAGAGRAGIDGKRCAASAHRGVHGRGPGSCPGMCLPRCCRGSQRRARGKLCEFSNATQELIDDANT